MAIPKLRLRTYEQRLITVVATAALGCVGFMFWLKPTWTAILLAVVAVFVGAAVWIAKGD